MQLSESVTLTLEDLCFLILVQVTIAFLATAWSNTPARDVHPEAASITNILAALDVALDRLVLGTSHRYRASACCRWHHRYLLHQWHWRGLHHRCLRLLLQSNKHVLLCRVNTRLIYCNSHGNIVFITSFRLLYL